MAPGEPAVPALEYDRTPPGYVSRRQFVALLALCALLALIVFGVFLGPVGMRAWRAWTAPPPPVTPPPPMVAVAAPPVFVPPPVTTTAIDFYEDNLPPRSRVLYEEDPTRAVKLLATDASYRKPSTSNLDVPYASGYQPPAMAFFPLEVRHEPHFGVTPATCTLFAHPRTSPAGNQRLVFLNLEVSVLGDTDDDDDNYHVTLRRRLNYRIFTVKGPDDIRSMRDGASLHVLSPPGDTFPVRWTDGVLRADRPASSDLRFFAGQPDPKDPSHFTVDFECGGTKGTLDAWLTDDDFLRVVPRKFGEVHGGDWYLTGKPPEAEAPR